MSKNEEVGFASALRAGVDHSACDFAWKQARCDRCGREYQCTPSDDHYCAAEGDHCCEPCLLGGPPKLRDAGGADRPATDPGDGRKECDRCGKWVFRVIHSCKGVPVTAAATARSAALRAAVGTADTRQEGLINGEE